MKLDEYQLAARRTAVYPQPLTYPVFGVCEEVGELIEVLVYVDLRSILNEMGDVMWYIASTAHDMGLKLSDVIGRKTFPTHCVDEHWLEDDVLEELAIAASKLAGAVKKWLRGDNGMTDVPDVKRVRILKQALRRIVWLLVGLCQKHNTSLEQVCHMNLEKISNRDAWKAERGLT